MGNGNIDVGNDTPTRKPGQPVVEDFSRSNGSGPRIDHSPKIERQEKIQGGAQHPGSLCGAMSQQGGEFRGNVSAPQKLLQLVGCRDRKGAPGLEARPYSNPVKR